MQDRQAGDEFQAGLLRRVAAKDQQAMAELYDETAAVLFATAWRILADRHEAEDVIQDVYVQIWEKASTFDCSMGTAMHWAMSITRNRSIDRLRAHGRRQRMTEALQAEPAAATPEEATAAHADLSEAELAQVRRIVGGLSVEQRQAIEMAFFGGMTHVEIAQALGEPLGTVKARIRRGMITLKESLQAYS